jgi:uncharacterized protein YndB with AHSA1/START domain
MSGEAQRILILKRVYARPIARLWRAWTDVTELGQWYMAGTDHIIHFAEADVRIGGSYRIGFGPAGKPPYVETGRYTEVREPTRLAFSEVVALEAEILGGSDNIVELRDLGAGRTELTLTCIGETAWRAAQGWVPCLESLSSHLGRVA